MFGNTYEEDIVSFKKVSASEADTLLSEKDLAVVYIGRESCPFCRKFAKKLAGLSDKILTTIYYVDSDNYSDDNINEFRNKYSINTVPGFIVSKENEVTVRCDSGTPEEEILAMIHN
ncbi:MAG: thioredoxin domain-containing protein [Sarcina sp.]